MISETSSDTLEAWSVDKEVLRRSLLSVSIRPEVEIEELMRTQLIIGIAMVA